jgi:hypothetical protein
MRWKRLIAQASPLVPLGISLLSLTVSKVRSQLSENSSSPSRNQMTQSLMTLIWSQMQMMEKMQTLHQQQLSELFNRLQAKTTAELTSLQAQSLLTPVVPASQENQQFVKTPDELWTERNIGWQDASDEVSHEELLDSLRESIGSI